MAKKSFIEQHWVWLVLVAFIVIVSYKPSTQSVICTSTEPTTMEGIANEMGSWTSVGGKQVTSIVTTGSVLLTSGETVPVQSILFTSPECDLAEAGETNVCHLVFVLEIEGKDCKDLINEGKIGDGNLATTQFETEVYYFTPTIGDVSVMWCSADGNVVIGTITDETLTHHLPLLNEYLAQFSFACEEGGFSCTGLG